MKGYKLAQHLYTSVESKEWLKRMHGRYKSPLEFYDVASQHFKGIMEVLSTQPRRIMAEVLLTYYKGISCRKLSQKTGYSINAVTSIINRLHKAKLIIKVTMGSKSIYRVIDTDFLGVCATRWDHAWLAFNDKYPDVSSIVDVFIAFRCGLFDADGNTEGREGE